MLVSAFRATLEEVIAADVILHIRDISHEDSDAQSADVAAILMELGVDAHDHARLVEVWNKIDLLDADRAEATRNAAERRPEANRPLVVSAVTGEGVEALLAAVEGRMARGRAEMSLALEASDGQGLHWLYENAEVMARTDGEDGAIHLTLRVAQDRLERLVHRFPAAMRVG